MNRLFLAGIAAAFSLTGAYAAEPGYYRVSGVAAGDVLNVRTEPDGTSQILESLEPGAAPVEVLEIENRGGSQWGRVLSDDSNGWVSMKFLEPAMVPMLGDTLVPDGLACSGTEPFWGATFSARDGIRHTDFDGNETVFAISRAFSAIARNHRFGVTASNGAMRATALLSKFEECTDGMSGRDFGWRIDFLLEREGDADFPQLYEGCCRLPVSE